MEIGNSYLTVLIFGKNTYIQKTKLNIYKRVVLQVDVIHNHKFKFKKLCSVKRNLFGRYGRLLQGKGMARSTNMSENL